MTIMRFEKIKCPECKTENEVKVWDTINAQVSPDDREALLHGVVNVFTCAGCGKTIHINKELLYHDMDNHFMVYFFPFDETKNNEFYSQFYTNGNYDAGAGFIPPEDMEPYQRNIHVVFGMDELVRYIMFREKLAKLKGVE